VDFLFKLYKANIKTECDVAIGSLVLITMSGKGQSIIHRIFLFLPFCYLPLSPRLNITRSSPIIGDSNASEVTKAIMYEMTVCPRNS
jgi:hypothetical protein